MKLYNPKLGKTIDATPLMLKSLAVKGWVEVKDEVEPTAINDEVESDKLFPYEDIKEDFNDDNKPKADPVKVKAKSKNKK
jgi:hypothetical protein